MGAGARDTGEENQEEWFLQHMKQTSKSKNHPTTTHIYHVDLSSSWLQTQSTQKLSIVSPRLQLLHVHMQAGLLAGPQISWSLQQLAWTFSSLQQPICQSQGSPVFSLDLWSPQYLAPKLHSLLTNHPGLLTCNHPHNMHMLLSLQLLPSQRHLWGDSGCLTGSPQTHRNTEQVAPCQGSMQK